MANELTDGEFPDTVLPTLSNPLTAMGNLGGSPLRVASNDPTFAAMLQQESGNKQFNKDGTPITSPKGAIGAAQVMPQTGPEAAALAGLPWDPQRLASDPDYNKALGSAYYQHQLATFGTPKLAAAAYNAGPGAVQKAIARANSEGGDPMDYLPAETQNYVANTTGKYQAKSGSVGEVASPPSPATTTISPLLSGQDPRLALMTLQSMYPQHKITPIDYDPWKYVTKLS